jgi:hypothetical protein
MMDTLSSSEKQQQCSDTNWKAYNLIARSVDIEHYENFPQGCSFSPDGLCILTATVGDSKLRLYNTPSSLISLQSSTQQSDKSDTTTTTNTNTKINDNQLENDKDNESHRVFDATNEVVVPSAATTTITTTTIVENWKTALSATAGESVRSYAW